MKNQTSEEWTEIISSDNNLLDLKLREVWRYRDLVRLFVWRDFISSYKQTILGPFWLVLNPLLSSLLYTVIFGMVANINMEGAPAFLFQLASNTCWGFIMRCFNSTQNTFLGNAGIFSKVYFPRLAVPIAGVFSNLIQFFILLGCYFIAFSFYKLYYNDAVSINLQGMLLMPVLLFISAIFGLGLGAIIASFTTKYRDFSLFVGYAMPLLMYVSAVVYPLSFIPEKYQVYMTYNPLVPLMEGFRNALLNIGSIDVMGLAYSAGISVVLFIIGIVLFNVTERDFIDTV
jgi:lipopolysaccharide transport system permease protein